MKRDAARLSGALLATLALAVVVPQWKRVGGREMVFLGDVLREHWPMQTVVSRELGAAPARVPVWNAWIACGAPLAPNPQYQLLYPPALVYRFLPFASAFGLLLVLHGLLAAVGAALFLRARGAGPRAAALGAVAFALGGHPTMLAATPPVFCSWAWLPWVALAADRAAARPGIATGAALGLTFAWVFLAGYPPTLIFAAVLALVLFLTPARPGPGLRAALVRCAPCVLAAIAVGAGVAAAGWAPFLGSLSSTAAAQPLNPDVVLQGAMPVWGLLGLLMPLSFLQGGEQGMVLGAPWLWTSLHHVGTLPLVLACSAPFLVPRLRLRAPGRLVLIGLVLAMGRHVPVLGPMLSAIPPLSMLRHPGAWGALAGFGLAWLAAEGAQGLEERLRTPAGRRVLDAWGAGLVFLGGLWIGSRLWHLGVFKSWLDRDAGPLTLVVASRLGEVAGPAGWLAVGLMALGLAVRREIPDARAFGFLGVLTWVELALHVGPAIQPAAPARVALQSSATDAFFAKAASSGWGRVLTTPRLEYLPGFGGEGMEGVVTALHEGFQSNVPATAGLRQAGGIGPLRPAGTATALERVFGAPARPWDAAPARQFDRMGVRWMIANGPLDGPGLTLRHRGLVRVYERDMTARPAWIEPDGAGRVRLAASARPGEWRIAAELERGGTVVVSESWVRGWRLEGAPATAAAGPTGDGLLGIALPAGRHEFTLRYAPPGGALAAAVSGASLLALLPLAFLL